MSNYHIIGGNPLKGTTEPIPNKNSIIKLIPASLLTDEPVIIHNVPKTSDVRIMLDLVRSLGGEVEYIKEDGSSIQIKPKNIKTSVLDSEISSKLKSGALFMAPLLLRFKEAFLPIPGGCKLGTRPMDAFISNMEEMGVEYEPTDSGFFLKVKELKSNKIWSWFPSVTATENLIMLAVKTLGRTEIYNAACEPHTQDLCNMLNSMGAKITGIGSNKLIIDGVEKLGGTVWNVIGEHLDVGAYIAGALITDGELTIKNAVTEHMGMIVQVFKKMNAKIEVDYTNDIIYVPDKQKLRCEVSVKNNIFDIKSFAWPMLPPDFVHLCIAVALKSEGSMIFHNSFYEFGYFYIEQFLNFGANIVMCDPHRVITFGSSNFKGAKIESPHIIQASVALFLFALGAEGKTELIDPYDSLIRRYPDLVEKYTKLGANAKKV